MKCYQVNGSTLLILEKEILPLFDDNVKISEFQTLTDSDKKKFEILW